MSDTARRLLIVSGAEAASADELPDDVRELIESAAEVLVVAPVLASRLHFWMNDTDRAREQADERLGTVLGQIASPEQDRAVAGVIGDDTPMMAFDDAVRLFAPDHILIGLRNEAHASWQEQGLLGRVRDQFGLPVTVVEIDDAGRVTGTRGADADQHAQN
jgi:hypothetical protein